MVHENEPIASTQANMPRDSEDTRGPRRPRRDRDRDRGRGRERDRDRGPEEMKERIDRDFAREIEMRISYFLRSEEPELELEPMNSYRRRMVHNVATKYRLRTESRGEDRERYVCLIKTEETGETGEQPPAAAPAGAGRGDDEAAPASAPARRGDEGAAPARPPRLWDFGSQTFPVNPGKGGVHLALKSDGSIELFSERNRSHILADRVVTAREFRIRQGRIVMPGEEGY